jgi:hypothetical protein
MRAVTTSSRSSAILGLTAVVGVVVAAAVIRKRTQRKSQKKSLYPEDDDDNEMMEEPDLPTHLIREIYKEKRRKASVRFLAMKKPMYDNIQMFSPEGEILCTIGEKKANWYVRKKLAEWKSNGDMKAVQLLFEPKGKSSEKTVYTISPKQNICVSCGGDEHFMRHYIVPHCYRTLFPEKFKTHMPHDIVILCPDCHLSVEQVTQRRIKRLEASLRKDPATANPVIPSRELHTIRSYSLALQKHSAKLPPVKRAECEGLIRSHFKLADDEALTAELIHQATELETHTPNPKYIPGPDLVAATLRTDELIETFVRDWRKDFLDVLQPRFLPTGWSVDSPVHCDYRNGD